MASTGRLFRKKVFTMDVIDLQSTLEYIDPVTHVSGQRVNGAEYPRALGTL